MKWNRCAKQLSGDNLEITHAHYQCAFFFGLWMWSTTTQKNSVKQIVGIIHELPKYLYIFVSEYRINDTSDRPRPAAAVIASLTILPARR